MNVFEKAHELGAMIVESEEYKKMTEARQNQDADNEAALVLMNYNRKRESLIKEASDPDISKERMQEIRNEMEKEINKLNQNKSIADFMNAMQNFNDMMEQVNRIVASYVSLASEGGCGGDCGSCGGCH